MLVFKTENENAVLKIHTDESLENPRDWDNIGSMICWHSRYALGDKHSFKTPQDFRAEVSDKNATILPLYLMDHSGLTMRTDPTMFEACDPAGWDWGQVGFIFASYDSIRREYGVKRVTKTIRQRSVAALEAEVSVYDQYLRGEVYGYVLRDKQTGEEDSCWGFFGGLATNGMSEYLGDHAVLLDDLVTAV